MDLKQFGVALKDNNQFMKLSRPSQKESRPPFIVTLIGRFT